ncbi:hydrogenase maturation protease [Anaerolineae bacterium]|nr:hydrogenase maturation protease [Anaerolineae bacterium]
MLDSGIPCRNDGASIQNENYPLIPPLLIFGYGNPSRGDDALGPLLLERLEAQGFPGVECLTDFQLQVEHALDLEGRELTLFIDAHLSCPPPFQFTHLHPEADRSYTTHAMSPASVLQVFAEIYRRPPPLAFLLSIRGERFELGEGLSPEAQANLEAAAQFAARLCARPEPGYWSSLCGNSSL